MAEDTGERFGARRPSTSEITGVNEEPSATFASEKPLSANEHTSGPEESAQEPLEEEAGEEAEGEEVVEADEAVEAAGTAAAEALVELLLALVLFEGAVLLLTLVALTVLLLTLVVLTVLAAVTLSGPTLPSEFPGRFGG